MKNKEKEITFQAKKILKNVKEHTINLLREEAKIRLPLCSYRSESNNICCNSHYFFKENGINVSLKDTFGHCYCQGLIGFIPFSFWGNVDNVTSQHLSTLPTHTMCRTMLRYMAKHSIDNSEIFSVRDTIASILAWSGSSAIYQRNKWSSWLFEEDCKYELKKNERIIDIKECLKKLNETGISQSIVNDLCKLPGIKLSYASKILFFFDQNNSCFIIDSRVKEALIEFFDFDVGNSAEKYLIYNEFLKKLNEKYNIVESPELLEILLWELGKLI